MATINVYSQYFRARCTANGVERHAALVMLISDSEAGTIQYEASVAFFPHNTEDDYAVSYDACYSTVIYQAAGRRSKKREKQYIDSIRDYIVPLAEQASGEVFWDEPLRSAQLG